MSNPYSTSAQVHSVAEATTDVRAQFITRTYGHLFGAIVAFTLIEVILFQQNLVRPLTELMLGAWWLVLILFIGVSWLGNSFALRARSLSTQYLGLGIYVVAEAIIFAPMLYIADSIGEASGNGLISSAALVTALGFSALTLVAFQTRKNFSFLRGVITFGSIMAMIAIFASFLFGFQLGVFFSIAMVALAGAIILFQTSNIIHEYPSDRYVGAALGLFAGVALMFWYVLQLFMAAED